MSAKRRRAPPRRRRAALEIVDRGRPRTPRALVRRVVDAALAVGGRADLAVSVLLTDDAEIARLHGRFLGVPTPTDVMSFDLGESADVVVSVETAARLAREHGHALRGEVALYIAHGLLHVCGFDDARARDRVRMREAERAVLQRLGLRVHRVDA